jgi:hypothetical protein
VPWYDQFLTSNDLDDDTRKQTEAQRENARAYETDREAWQPHFERAIEYPASRIFVALKGGLLPAKGRLLPSDDIDEAFSRLKADDQDVFDIPLTDVHKHSGASKASTSKRVQEATGLIDIATSPATPTICFLFSQARERK